MQEIAVTKLINIALENQKDVWGKWENWS